MKHKFEDEAFREINLRWQTRKKDIEIPAALHLISDTTKMISSQKYDDLISLLQFLPGECHIFYRNLRHEQNAREYPVDDDYE